MLRKLLFPIILLAVGGAGVARSQFRDAAPQLPISNNAIVAQYQFTTCAAPDVLTRSARSLGIDEDVKTEEPTKKSSLLAAGLSLVVPGLGEYYVGDQIWRGAIFTLLEGGLWYGRYHWTKRGDDSLVMFHAWADSLWLPTRYVGYLDSLLATRQLGSLITDPNNFSQINHEEDSLSSLGFENFTHRLPPRGAQQYYELISKYIQFTAGWVDDVTHNPADSKDYQRHADMRESMNHQYEVADDFLYGIIINHILSAIDAALLAKDHNSNIHLHGELQQTTYPDGTFGFIPTAAIQVTF